MTALRTRLGLEALSGERRALVEARLDDLYESRGGDRAWAEAAEGDDGAKPAAPPRAAVAEAARVQQLLQLDHSLGFVQLGRAAEAPTGGREEGWHPLAVHFGLPLFDVPLCGAACARVASGDLLQNESVAAYRARSAELLARLNAFVGRHADADEVAAAAAEGGVAYPVHDLEFDGAALRVLPAEV